MKLLKTAMRVGLSLVLVSLLFPIHQSDAQTALGDADGKTSLVLMNGGAVSVNFTDSSAKGGYLYWKTSKPFRFGVEFSGKAANGYSSLFDGEDISPEASAKLSVGYQPVKHRTAEGVASDTSNGLVRDYWLTLEAGYRRGEYTMINEEAKFGSETSQEEQDSPSVTFYANALVAGNILGGLSVGYARENNYEDLSKVEAIDTTIVATSGSTTRTTAHKVTGRSGDYQEFDEFTVNADFMWIPPIFAKRLGIDLFVRYSSPQGEKDTFEPGVGFFIVEKDSPSRIVAGITVKRDDINDAVKLGFVAGYSF